MRKNKDYCTCPNCAPYTKPQKPKKVKTPKEYTLKSALLKTIENSLNFARLTMWFFAWALIIATIIGGLFFNLTASVIATWFAITLIIVVGSFFALTFTLFLIYFMKRMAAPLLFGIVGVMIASFICIAPDLTPFIELDKTLAPLLGFLDKALF